MRTLGEQWIENGRMYKAVPGREGSTSCGGCTHLNHNGSCALGDKEISCPRHIDFGCVIRDLGPVNNIGLPLCPFCKGYPELESEENWEGKDIWFVECDECGVRTAEYFEASEAVDAWKRRA